MVQVSKVANAFLDGFGSLGAVFEPVIRPGSQDNLIQQPVDLSSDVLKHKGEHAQVATAAGFVFQFFVLKWWVVSLTVRRSADEITEVGDKAHHGA